LAKLFGHLRFSEAKHSTALITLTPRCGGDRGGSKGLSACSFVVNQLDRRCATEIVVNGKRTP